MRFIDLGKQIGIDEEWPREFCFWNTVSDRFLEFGGYQVWTDWKDFTGDFDGDAGMLERLKGLCPSWVFTDDTD